MDTKEETKGEEVDERTKRTTKLVDSFELSHETDLTKVSTFLRHQALARATTFARNIANVRANPGDPDYIE